MGGREFSATEQRQNKCFTSYRGNNVVPVSTFFPELSPMISLFLGFHYGPSDICVVHDVNLFFGSNQLSVISAWCCNVLVTSCLCFVGWWESNMGSWPGRLKTFCNIFFCSP